MQDKLKMGAFSTRTVLFDPFTCFYEVKHQTQRNLKDSLKMGGKDLYLASEEV